MRRRLRATRAIEFARRPLNPPGRSARPRGTDRSAVLCVPVPRRAAGVRCAFPAARRPQVLAREWMTAAARSYRQLQLPGPAAGMAPPHRPVIAVVAALT